MIGTGLTLRSRVVIAFGLGSVAVAGLLALVTWNLASGYMIGQRELSASRQAAVNLRLVQGALRTDPAAGIEELLSGLATGADKTVALNGPEGWTVSGRQINPAALPDELLTLAADGVPARQRLIVAGVPVIAVAMPVGAPGTIYLELFALTDLDRTFRFLSSVLLAGVLVSGLLGLGLGRWAGRRALRPLVELTAAAGKVAAGDRSARLPERGDPDLAPLAATFNRTTAALEERVRRDARFAGDVSHELRSPLTTMVNAVEVLRRRRTELPEAARLAVDLLDADVQRFRRMVDDLLEIARTDEDADDRELEALDLGALVRNVAAARRDAPTVDVTEPGPLVLADRRRLDRVVANLLDNAARHGGGVRRIAVGRRAGRARLEVDDAGPGVPPQLRERVFERFDRGRLAGDRGDGTGSGLGLALVAQHTERHHGTVWVQDRPGGGARFVVELPELAP